MAGGSQFAVYTAIGANIVVMVAKFIGFAMTGSGAMLAEGIHSIADVGNQSLLAVGMHRSALPADHEHPFGYGQEAFIWSIISAVGIFFLGCGVTIAHGVHSLLAEQHVVEGQMIAIYILLFSLCIEGLSFGVALRELKHAAAERSLPLIQHLKTTDDPFGIAVLFEDGAAVLGVLIALSALAMSQYTHQPYWDAIGSIGVGVLLGVLALFLIQRNRRFLIGKAIPEADQRRMTELLANDPAVENVAIQRAVISGASRYRISAEVDLDGGYMADQYLKKHSIDAILKSLDSAEALHTFLHEYGEDLMTQVGLEIDRIEAKLVAEFPQTENVAIEPD